MAALSEKSAIFPVGSYGRINGGVDFFPGDLYNFANTDDFSISFGVWLLHPSDQILLGKVVAAIGYEFRITNGQIFFSLEDTGGGRMSVRTGAVGEYGTDVGWAHVTASWNGSAGNDAANAAMYVNGVPATLSAVSDSLSATIANNQTLQFSGSQGATNALQNGVLDWIGIWNTVLTPAEALAIYNGGDLANLLTIQQANLTGFWPFEFDPYEQTGPTDVRVKNMIANGSRSTVNGAVTVDFSRNNNNRTSGTITQLETPASPFGGISTRSISGGRASMGDVLKKDVGSVFSVSFWFLKSVIVRPTEVWFGKGLAVGPTFRGWFVDTPASGAIRMSIYGDNSVLDQVQVETTATYLDGLPHHCVATIDGTETAAGLLIYIDGVLAPKTTNFDAFVNATYDTNAELQISGANASGLFQLFPEERISEVQIYDYVLPLTAVAGIPSVVDIYNSGSPKYPTALFDTLAPEGWWRVGEEFNAVDMIVGNTNDIVEVGFGKGPGGSSDITPPVVTLISPTSGILQASASVTLRVIDLIDLQRAVIMHTPAGGSTEIVHDGDAFRQGYTGTVTTIANGIEVECSRVGGFFPPLDFEVLAYDASGNES